MNTLIPFGSRAEALRLSRLLNARRIANTVINTPRRLGVSCGLSVLFDDAYLGVAKEMIEKEGLRTQLGIFKR